MTKSSIRKAPFWTRKFVSSTCPCGSSKVSRLCCYTRNDEWYKKPQIITLPGNQTGFSNPKCFFSHYADCSQKISREHYISEAILSQFEWDDSTLEGFPYLLASGTKPPIKGMVAKILCKRHNEALSPLDASAAQFFQNLKYFSLYKEEYLVSDKKQFLITSGTDLERWMLKTLCTTLAAGIARNKGNILGKDAIKPLWLDILLSKQKFVEGNGLYFEARIGQNLYAHETFAFAPILDKSTDEVIGSMCDVAGFNFILIATKNLIMGSDTLRYHPPGIITKGGDKKRRMIEISW